MHFGSPKLFIYDSRNERTDLNEEQAETPRFPVAKGQGSLFIKSSDETPGCSKAAEETPLRTQEPKVSAPLTGSVRCQILK